MRNRITLYDKVNPKQAEQAGEEEGNTLRGGCANCRRFKMGHYPIEKAHDGRQSQGTDEASSNSHCRSPVRRQNARRVVDRRLLCSETHKSPAIEVAM